jgi:transcriptional regulator with XRE-family HTH domain
MLSIQQKLTELGLDQRDLADATQVTESYISQLLSRKKMPPPPERADICDKLERTLNLPTGRFAGLADLQRRQELNKTESPILFALDHSDGEVQPVPAGKLLLTCPLAKCRHQADYSTATVSRFQKEPSA